MKGSTNDGMVVGASEIDPSGEVVYVPTIGGPGAPVSGGESITTLSSRTLETLSTFALALGSFPESIAIIRCP